MTHSALSQSQQASLAAQWPFAMFSAYKTSKKKKKKKGARTQLRLRTVSVSKAYKDDQLPFFPIVPVFKNARIQREASPWPRPRPIVRFTRPLIDGC